MSIKMTSRDRANATDDIYDVAVAKVGGFAEDGGAAEDLLKAIARFLRANTEVVECAICGGSGMVYEARCVDCDGEGEV